MKEKGWLYELVFLHSSFALFKTFFLFIYLLGAASDMEASNKIAHAMVSIYGMSDKVL